MIRNPHLAVVDEDEANDLVHIGDVPLTIWDVSAQLAAELAAQLDSKANILDRFGISVEQWNRLRQSQVFKQMLKEKLEEFRGAANVNKRIRMKAGIAAEDTVVDLHAIAVSRETTPSVRIEAMKLLNKLAGTDAPEGEGGGRGFSITINLGGHAGDQEIDVTPRLNRPVIEAQAE